MILFQVLIISHFTNYHQLSNNSTTLQQHFNNTSTTPQQHLLNFESTFYRLLRHFSNLRTSSNTWNDKWNYFIIIIIIINYY